MRRLIPAIALLAASCASPGAPQQQAWSPQYKGFGNDDAIARQAFCGVLFSGFSDASPEGSEEKAMFDRLTQATVINIRMLDGAKQQHTDAQYGISAAIEFLNVADEKQLTAAGERCIDLVMAK